MIVVCWTLWVKVAVIREPLGLEFEGVSSVKFRVTA